jgi:hypothetical protein
MYVILTKKFKKIGRKFVVPRSNFMYFNYWKFKNEVPENKKYKQNIVKNHKFKRELCVKEEKFFLRSSTHWITNWNCSSSFVVHEKSSTNLMARSAQSLTTCKLKHNPSGVLSGRIPCWTSVPHPCEVWHWWNTLV